MPATDAAQAAVPDDRGDEARLCGSRVLPRRSRRGEDAGRTPDLEGLCRRLARQHRSGARDARRATSAPAAPVQHEGHNTTHFSVVDRYGNAVANTYTLNFSYGVGLVAAGTGILLNNELDDFAAKPDAPNAYGLLGFAANAPGPGKRPLSSMTPTIVLKDGKPFLDHRLARRQPHHHRGAASRRQRASIAAWTSQARYGAARAQPMDAGPGVCRAWLSARPDRGARSPRRCRHRAAADDVGQLDPGHALRLGRCRRSAHTRCLGSGLLIKSRSRLLARRDKRISHGGTA